MHSRVFPLFVLLLLTAPAQAANGARLEDIVDEVVHRHMAAKSIPGMSVSIVQDEALIFAKGYGKASLEFDVPAAPATVYPVSSVSKIFAGLVALRLVEAGKLGLDVSVAEFFPATPADKRALTVRHLLQHTHGLEDFYGNERYRSVSGKSVADSTASELIRWSLDRPLRHAPGTAWEYSLVGYVMLARVLESAGGLPYEELVRHYVFEPVGMTGAFGGTETVLPGRNPVLYVLNDDTLAGHIVEFPAYAYAAGGLNTSAMDLANLFVALSGADFIADETKQVLWSNPVLADGNPANYGLGWFSYTTSRGRRVVGHEGGGASWVIYYPDLDLAVIALSNMSGARADSLPYEIARNALAEGLLRSH